VERSEAAPRCPASAPWYDRRWLLSWGALAGARHQVRGVWWWYRKEKDRTGPDRTGGQADEGGDAVSEVVDRPDEGRFELTVEEQTALLVYRVEGASLVLIHTEVPEALGGRGLGGVLVEAAVEWAVRDGLTIVPLCPFAVAGCQTVPTRRPGHPSTGKSASSL
jgi:predicted GNAT family acetyltransferase